MTKIMSGKELRDKIQSRRPFKIRGFVINCDWRDVILKPGQHIHHCILNNAGLVGADKRFNLRADGTDVPSIIGCYIYGLKKGMRIA